MMFKNSALIVGLCCTAIVTESASSTPVIGILSQPFINSDNETEYFIAGSYVQWLEAAGARSIAIPYDSTNVDEYFPQINGLFFPGGGIDEIPNSAWRLWELALDANSVGHFFPVWGTCLGFEYMVMMASGMGLAAMSHGFDATNISLPLELTSSESLLYRQTRIREIALTQNVTMNNHHLGLSLDTFASSPDLAAMFHATSVNTDRQGRSFVSTIEPIYPDLNPFYGVQYHPEKNLFEYGTYPDTNVPYEAIHHDPDAIDFSLHLARFFVNLANHNLEQGIHQYTQPDVYPMVYTYPMRPGVKFQQSYIIPSGSEQSVASEL